MTDSYGAPSPGGPAGWSGSGARSDPPPVPATPPPGPPPYPGVPPPPAYPAYAAPYPPAPYPGYAYPGYGYPPPAYPAPWGAPGYPYGFPPAPRSSFFLPVPARFGLGAAALGLVAGFCPWASSTYSYNFFGSDTFSYTTGTMGLATAVGGITALLALAAGIVALLASPPGRRVWTGVVNLGIGVLGALFSVIGIADPPPASRSILYPDSSLVSSGSGWGAWMAAMACIVVAAMALWQVVQARGGGASKSDITGPAVTPTTVPPPLWP